MAISRLRKEQANARAADEDVNDFDWMKTSSGALMDFESAIQQIDSSSRRNERVAKKPTLAKVRADDYHKLRLEISGNIRGCCYMTTASAHFETKWCVPM